MCQRRIYKRFMASKCGSFLRKPKWGRVSGFWPAFSNSALDQTLLVEVEGSVLLHIFKLQAPLLLLSLVKTWFVFSMPVIPPITARTHHHSNQTVVSQGRGSSVHWWGTTHSASRRMVVMQLHQHCYIMLDISARNITGQARWRQSHIFTGLTHRRKQAAFLP